MPLADPRSHINGSVSSVGDPAEDHCCRRAQRPMANQMVSSLVPVDRHARASRLSAITAVRANLKARNLSLLKWTVFDAYVTTGHWRRFVPSSRGYSQVHSGEMRPTGT